MSLLAWLLHHTAEMLRVVFRPCHLEELSYSPNYSLNKMVWPLPLLQTATLQFMHECSLCSDKIPNPQYDITVAI